jgi:hypothetical protein
LTTNDGAIQLILILDHLVDWARDSYRPSILTALKSIVTGRRYDEVSLDMDDDIQSTKQRVHDWLGPTPPTSGYDFEHLQTVAEDDPEILHSDRFLSMDPPKTRLGSVRFASMVDFRFSSLDITEDNLGTLLLQSGETDAVSDIRKHARQLINMITGWDELLLISQYDLNEVEHMWTGKEMASNPQATAPSDVEVYAVFEYRCFLDPSWTMVKELTCFAVSKPAFEIIKRFAALKTSHPGIKGMPNIVRACPGMLLREAIECLLAGSPLQILRSAISSTLMSIYPEPVKEEGKFTPPVKVLNFGSLKWSLIGLFIEKYSKSIPKKPSRRVPVSGQAGVRKRGRPPANAESIRQKDADIQALIFMLQQRKADRSFRRRSSSRNHIRDMAHNPYSCRRCENGLQTQHAQDWDPIIRLPLLNNTILVEALQADSTQKNRPERHDICLFVVEKRLDIVNGAALSSIVDGYLRGGSIYHAILHKPSYSEVWSSSQICIWNVPHPYRPCTKRQQADIIDWVRELKGEEVPPLRFGRTWMHLWDHLQILLYFLRKGKSFQKALSAVKDFRDVQRVRREERNHTLTGDESSDDDHNGERVGNLKSFWALWESGREGEFRPGDFDLLDFQRRSLREKS